jgi:hypothetical protein
MPSKPGPGPGRTLEVRRPARCTTVMQAPAAALTAMMGWHGGHGYAHSRKQPVGPCAAASSSTLRALAWRSPEGIDLPGVPRGEAQAMLLQLRFPALSESNEKAAETGVQGVSVLGDSARQLPRPRRQKRRSCPCPASLRDECASGGGIDATSKTRRAPQITGAAGIAILYSCTCTH